MVEGLLEDDHWRFWDRLEEYGSDGNDELFTFYKDIDPWYNIPRVADHPLLIVRTTLSYSESLQSVGSDRSLFRAALTDALKIWEAKRRFLGEPLPSCNY